MQGLKTSATAADIGTHLRKQPLTGPQPLNIKLEPLTPQALSLGHSPFTPQLLTPRPPNPLQARNLFCIWSLQSACCTERRGFFHGAPSSAQLLRRWQCRSFNDCSRACIRVVIKCCVMGGHLQLDKCSGWYILLHFYLEHLK